jgi:hypothetical protein
MHERGCMTVATINVAKRAGWESIVFKVELSPLFLAVGAYKDQRIPMYRIHVPFVRVTIGKLNGILER